MAMADMLPFPVLEAERSAEKGHKKRLVGFHGDPIVNRGAQTM